MVLGSCSWNCFRTMTWDVSAHFIRKPVPLAWENRAAEHSAGIISPRCFYGEFLRGP